MDSLDFQLIFDRVRSPFSALQLSYTFYHKKRLQKNCRYLHTIEHTQNKIYIQVCFQAMYPNVGSQLWIHLIFSSSLRPAGAHFRPYNSRTHSIAKSIQKTAGRHIQQRLHTKHYLYQVCTQAMYSILGSHLWTRLIFSSSLIEAGALFWRNNSRTHSITKKPTKNKGRYIQQRTYINNYLNLCIYLENVLYCSFSFMDPLGFQLIFESGRSPFSAL